MVKCYGRFVANAMKVIGFVSICFIIRVVNAMPFKIESVRHLGVLKVIYSGAVTLDERINVVHSLCVDHYDSTRFRIYIDARLVDYQLSVAEQEVFGAYIASREEFKDALVAVVVNDGQVKNKNIITKSSKSGQIINIFDNEDDALQWLVSQSV
ncbi:hypothetical protein KO525_15800 [Psychrosphaera sp. B3R10]|uniref:hypothetical protein n=2 Tax=unclassified Psychrosphaera TaxID=2641570 RepID=UPI001C08BDAB|nr:hypothetical protein [Psychrosphaera sp. I2R16]MBU2880925.1 hypothetical protein [Psychrosphaera sp. I2R16]MBU2990856.1 hypothetical protein [Psychrosphaera sp. B3R10]